MFILTYKTEAPLTSLVRPLFLDHFFFVLTLDLQDGFDTDASEINEWCYHCPTVSAGLHRLCPATQGDRNAEFLRHLHLYLSSIHQRVQVGHLALGLGQGDGFLKHLHRALHVAPANTHHFYFQSLYPKVNEKEQLQKITYCKIPLKGKNSIINYATGPPETDPLLRGRPRSFKCPAQINC